MAKQKINLGGREYQAESVEFETEREGWNSYVLHDGTELRLKAVVSQIMRVEGAYAPNGDPLYLVQSSNIVVTNAPDKLKGPPTPPTTAAG
jgi:hypothetical protein